MCPVIETIQAHGHRNVKATHPSTLEITKEEHLSMRGDCIFAVGANKGLNDLSSDFRNCLKKPDARVIITVQVGGIAEAIKARGCSNLTLLHPSEIVIRKSNFVSDRTLAVQADKAAVDLSRELVEKLKNPRQTIRISLEVSV